MDSAPRRRLAELTTAQCVAIILIVFAAAAFRLWWNNVSEYSPADEAVYAGYTRTLVEQGFVAGYPEIVRAFVEQPRRWTYPSPIRWGYFALAAATAKLYGSAEPSALALLSTICGIAVVPLTFLFALRRFGAPSAILAAAFVAVSPLELALGRRALQDEVFCFAVVLALLLFDIALDHPRWTVPAILAMTFAYGVKETFFWIVPAFGAFALVRSGVAPASSRPPADGGPAGSRRYTTTWAYTGALLLVPPLLYFAIFTVLSRSTSAFFRITSILNGAMRAPYVVQFQSGPPHRLLFDFFVAAPFVSILAAGAVAIVLLGYTRGHDERALTAFVVIAFALLAVAPAKNLRFLVMLDPIVRVLAAWLLSSRSLPVLLGAALANAAIELELFHAMFIRGDVYDPTTHDMLQAVGAIPNRAAAPTLVFPWIVAAIALIAWAWSAHTRARQSSCT